MVIKRILLEYREKRSENYQTVEHGATVEILLNPEEQTDNMADALALLANERAVLVNEVTGWTLHDIVRINDEKNGSRG